LTLFFVPFFGYIQTFFYQSNTPKSSWRLPQRRGHQQGLDMRCGGGGSAERRIFEASLHLQTRRH
jgi:hypothetical protein